MPNHIKFCGTKWPASLIQDGKILELVDILVYHITEEIES